MSTRIAVIDLGTNTFHLLIAEKQGDKNVILYRESLPARIGKGGINKNEIQPDAFERGLSVLMHFRTQLDAFSVEDNAVHAFGTSALRNAVNGEKFCATIQEQLRITIQVIQGDEEAELIYWGVRDAVALGAEPVLIVDIGGGSVEFIIGTQERIIWKQSFEIGGQRLMEKFMRKEIISPSETQRLFNYVDEKLIDLSNAIHQYAPTTLVGSSGTFDTLIDIEYHYKTAQWPPVGQAGFEYSKEEFYRVYPLLLSSNREERLAIPGMIPLRVDMIVVAVCLIDYLFKTFNLQSVKVSKNSLKEGVLAKLMQ